MEAGIVFHVPSLAAHAVYLALLFSGVCFAWQGSRVFYDRKNEADFRRKCAWQLTSPHLAPGEAWMAPNRPSFAAGMYQTRPYRGSYPSEERALAA